MHRVFALKLAESTTPACQFYYREPSHEPITLYYYCWLILGGHGAILVDTGFRREDAERRGLRQYVDPVELLRRVGVTPSDIRTVLLTHLHWDHYAAYRAFPSAEFWIQQQEAVFWLTTAPRFALYRKSHDPDTFADFLALTDRGRLRMISGSAEIGPGLALHWVGGHTPGLQVVSIRAAEGALVLASDAVPLYRNLEHGQPSQILTDMLQTLVAFDTIRTLAGRDELVIPGHDPEIVTRFQGVDEGIIRLL